MTIAHKNNNDSYETRTALLEQSIGHIGQTLLRLENKIDKVDLKIDNVDKSLSEKINNVEKSLNLRIDKIDSRLWSLMFLIASSIVGIFISKIIGWYITKM